MYAQSLFHSPVAFLKKRRKQKCVNQNTIFPLEIRGWRNRRQQANGRYTENKRAQVKNWCKLARDVKAKGRKTNGRKQELGVLDVVGYRALGVAVEAIGTAGRSSYFLDQTLTKG